MCTKNAEEKEAITLDGLERAVQAAAQGYYGDVLQAYETHLRGMRRLSHMCPTRCAQQNLAWQRQLKLAGALLLEESRSCPVLGVLVARVLPCRSSRGVAVYVREVSLWVEPVAGSGDEVQRCQQLREVVYSQLLCDIGSQPSHIVQPLYQPPITWLDTQGEKVPYLSTQSR